VVCELEVLADLVDAGDRRRRRSLPPGPVAAAIAKTPGNAPARCEQR